MRFDQTKLMRGLLLLAAILLASCGGGGGGGSAGGGGGGTTTYYSISVTVTGLSETLVLHNNRNLSSDPLTFTAPGSATFTATVASGTPYGVTVASQPANQFCTVTNGSGTATANVTNVAVNCVTAYTIGGTVSGLNGTGLVLQNNNGDNLPVSAGATTFTFSTKLISGSAYSVTMLNRPRSPVQICTVTGGTGTVAAANVASVTVACSDNPTIPDKPRYAYVANSTNNTVSGYIVDALTGQLRPNGYVYVGANTTPASVAVDPSGQFAYVANSAGDNVSAYTIGADGRLTFVSPTIAAGDAPSSVTVDPSGRYVYVTNSLGQDITAYSINLSTGALTRIPCIGGVVLGCSGNNPLNYLTGASPTSISVAPAGLYAYVANSSGVSGYSIDGYGGLTAIDTAAAGGAQAYIAAGSNPNSIGIDPSGAFAYVANGGGDVSGYTINSSGALTSVGAAVPAETTPRSIAVDPYGLSIYVANTGTNSVSAYDIAPGAGTLSPLGVASAGTGPTSVAVDPSGTYAYVVNNTVAGVSVYTFDSTGLPVAAAGAAASVRGRAGSAAIAMTKGAIAVTYTPTFAYVANSGTNNVSGYSINPSTGVLTSLGAATNAGTGPTFVTVDPAGRFAYVANGGSTNDISVYEIDPATGALAANTTAAAGTGPGAVTVDPSGRFAYVTNSAGEVWGYTIDQAIGELTPIDMNGTTAGTHITAEGTNPRSVTVDPTGQFAYVAHDGGVSAYLIAASSGVLSQVGTYVAAGATPSSVAVDPTGKYAYVANSVSNNVSGFSINPGTGELTSLGATNAGTGPKAIAIDPTGKYAYVANNGSDNISAFTINASTGVLTLGTSPYALAASAGPKSVTVDISGAYLYVANNNGTVLTFTIGVGGALSGGATIAAGTNPASIATTGTVQ